MVKVIVVVREAGRESPDYSLDFELPQVPEIGSFISITREGEREPFSEDVVVRHVWYRLKHPTRDGLTEDRQVGRVTEVFVECDIAEGPYASDHWRKVAEAARRSGAKVDSFPISRFSVRESDLA